MAVDDGKTERDSSPSLVEAAFWAAIELSVAIVAVSILGFLAYIMFGSLCR